jgi:PTH1 family peptidyl-tRNA hydrolase
MNESGRAVFSCVTGYKLQVAKDLVVVHDDLDIPLGKFHIQKGIGPKLHNGIESIEAHLKTKDFWRIRIGIDNRASTGPMNGESYVLQDFKPEERNILQNIIFPKILSEFNRHV